MGRVNERCFEFSPEEIGLKFVDVDKSTNSDVIDLRGAKIFCCWIKCDKLDVTVVFRYLDMHKDEILQESAVLPLEANKYTRFQFGVYAQLQLPAMFIQIVVTNKSGERVNLSAHGMLQLQ
jgi:hypothetical protein